MASDTSLRRRLRCLSHGTLDGLSPEPVEASAVATISRHVHRPPATPRSEMLCRKHQPQIWRTNHAEHTSLRLGLRGHRVCLPDGSAGSAQPLDKRTLFTFSAPVTLPGVTLPAGQYLFRLADPNSSAKVVQVLNAEAPSPTDCSSRSLPSDSSRPRRPKCGSWKPHQGRPRPFGRGGTPANAGATSSSSRKIRHAAGDGCKPARADDSTPRRQRPNRRTRRNCPEWARADRKPT